MNDRGVNLPRQQEIRAKCFHPSGAFIEFPRDEVEQSITARFERIAWKYPDRIAVKTRNQQLTYRELNNAANCVAQAILARCAARNEPVALMFAKGVSLVGAILGVLKSGKMFVLLDPTLPQARLRYMLADSQANLIVANDEYCALAAVLAQNVSRLNIDDLNISLYAEAPQISRTPSDFAYILYTSGSTGQPRGIVENHRNLLHYIMTETNDLHICAEDRLTFLASQGRDIFRAVLNGAAVYPLEIKQDGLGRVARWLIEEEITIYNSVASAFRDFVNTLTEVEQFPNLRLIKLMGETVYRRDVELYRKHFSERCILVNWYGPNETGLLSHYLIDSASQITSSVVPVGYAVKEKEILILDEDGNDLGAQQPGEIAVKSRYLSPEYWRRPDLTRAAFIPLTPEGTPRLYRTGDLGTLDSDGCLMHLGRKDFQVKIRGYRVEIAEVEMALLDFDPVKEAVVVAREDVLGQMRLIAYIVLRSMPAPTTSAFRAALTVKLPDYMVPSVFVILDKMPVIGIGKIDRNALPAPTNCRPALDEPYVPPRTPLEEELSRIWADTLGVDPVGIDDNFFNLGGHSLLAAKLFARLDQAFGRSLPLSVLFSAPTIRTLAERYCTSETLEKSSVLIALRGSGSLPPIYAVPGVFGNVIGYVDLSRELGHQQPFYGLQSIGLDGAQAPLDSVEKMAKLYLSEIREIQSHGPYALIGACFGTRVAYEMTRQLHDADEEVAFLGLLDPVGLERDETIENLLSMPPIIQRAKTLGSFVTDRLRLYLEELRSLEDGNRIQFITRKIRSLSFNLGDRRAIRGVRREFHQLEVFKANMLAGKRYYRKPLKGRLRTLEIFESAHPRNAKEWMVDWKPFWNGDPVRHPVPGKDSGDMVSDENARLLATLLAERLRAAFARSSPEPIWQNPNNA